MKTLEEMAEAYTAGSNAVESRLMRLAYEAGFRAAREVAARACDIWAADEMKLTAGEPRFARNFEMAAKVIRTMGE